MTQERRSSILTADDIEAIRLLLREEHVCRYDISQQEMEELRTLNANLQAVKKRMLNRTADWFVIIILALLTAGAWSRLEALVKKFISGGQ